MSPTPATFSTLRTTVGVAKETTKGTAVVPDAFLPVKQINATPKVTKLLDQGWRGSMGDLYGMQNGVQSAELDLQGDVFVDTIPYLLTGVLGDLVNAGIAVPYTNTIALLNSGDGQPSSYTFTDTQGGLQARAYPGCQVTEVALKFDASGLLTFDAKALGWLGSTAATPAAAFGSEIPVAAWLAAMTIGGAADLTVQNAEITFKRANAEAIHTLGAKDPYKVHVGGIEVDTKFTFVAATEAPLLAYLNGTEQAVSCLFSQGTNSKLQITMSKHQHDSGKVTRGKSYVEIETTGKAILNATDVGGSAGLSPAKVVVTNSVATPKF